MRSVKFLISGGLVFAVFLFLYGGIPGAGSTEKENHCFTCHTNASKLIQITREIENAKKGQPKAEVKSEGEG